MLDGGPAGLSIGGTGIALTQDHPEQPIDLNAFPLLPGEAASARPPPADGLPAAISAAGGFPAMFSLTGARPQFCRPPPPLLDFDEAEVRCYLVLFCLGCIVLH